MKDKILKEMLENYKNGMSIEKIYKKYGGISIYIPKIDPLVREKIKEEFNGYNKIFLAHKYNLSIRSIEKIVKNINKK